MNKMELSDEIIAAMQADRDNKMTLAQIAKKYGISTTAVRNRVTDKDKPAKIEKKKYSLDPNFVRRWNAVRYRVLGIRPGWCDEWNEVRTRILAGKK